MKNLVRNLSLIIGSIMLLVVLAVTAQAETITVTSDADTASEDDVCTLREAIIAANDNDNAHEDDCTAGEAAPAVVDEIVFDAAAFPPAGSTTIDLGSNLPDITESVNITGPGYNALTIDGDGNADIGLVINSSSDDQTLSVSGLTVANYTEPASVGIWVAKGDTLNLTGSRITGIDTASGTGLFNVGGTAHISSSIIDTNTSENSGAGIINTEDAGTPGTMTITSSLITGNEVTGADDDGGGILNTNESTLTITSSLISNNSADDDGGGIYNDNATLTVTSSHITGNTASGSSGDEAGGGIANDNGGTATINNHSVISNNTAEQSGGGVSNDNESTMTITDSTISSNIGNNGCGGALNFGGSSLDISNSTIADNSAILESGGGVCNVNDVVEIATLSIDGSTIARNTAGTFGGGIANIGPIAETTITNSTIANNAALEGAGIVNAFVAACIEVENSTISGNTALDAAGGIGDGNSDNNCSKGYAVSLLNVTITQNLSDTNLDGTGGGGGIFVADTSGDFNITNTIIAGNFDPFIGPDCATIAGPDGIQSGGHNLIGTLDGCDDNDFDDVVLLDQFEVAAMLDVLTPLNGGDPANGIPTGVHFPLVGSPAIDNGDDLAAPATDQLNVTRPIGAASDIGAVEAGCGNGEVNPGEECDDGGESAACNANCTDASCGDGIVNASRGEECDDAGESDTCNANCTLKGVAAGVCGNGVVEGGEDCDDGGESEDCNFNCTVAECGDGILNRTSGEVCEDGNTDDGDTCSSTCKKEQNVACALIPAANTTNAATGAIPLMLLMTCLALGLSRKYSS